MNYEHVCASLLWVGSVTGCSGGILCLLHFVDADFGKIDFRKIRRLWIVYSLGISVILLPHIGVGNSAVWIAYGLLSVYLILSSVMDYVLEMVCDFFHYIGLLGGCILLLGNHPKSDSICSLLIFVVIQWIVFRKMYGLADVAAFMVCAVYFAAEGKSMPDYLEHMAVSFAFLGVIQGFKRNISRRGNLKHPVALLPYITAGFFVII